MEYNEPSFVTPFSILLWKETDPKIHDWGLSRLLFLSKRKKDKSHKEQLTECGKMEMTDPK